MTHVNCRLQTFHNMCILYNQRDATYTVFFIIISALHVSGGFFAHHQELCMCSLGYSHAFLLSTAGVDGLEQTIHTSSRQQESMTIPKATHTVL